MTAADAMVVLTVVVDREGCTTRRSCRYVAGPAEHRQPWCIAGCALIELSVPLADLVAMDNTPIPRLWEKYRDSYLQNLDLTAGAVRVLFMAQSLQDCGRTWGDSLTAAAEEAEKWKGKE